MTVETAPGRAGATSAGPAGRSLLDRVVRRGILLAVGTNILRDRCFQATVITGIFGARAV